MLQLCAQSLLTSEQVADQVVQAQDSRLPGTRVRQFPLNAPDDVVDRPYRLHVSPRSALPEALSQASKRSRCFEREHPLTLNENRLVGSFTRRDRHERRQGVVGHVNPTPRPPAASGAAGRHRQPTRCRGGGRRARSHGRGPGHGTSPPCTAPGGVDRQADRVGEPPLALAAPAAEARHHEAGRIQLVHPGVQVTDHVETRPSRPRSRSGSRSGTGRGARRGARPLA